MKNASLQGKAAKLAMAITFWIKVWSLCNVMSPKRCINFRQTMPLQYAPERFARAKARANAHALLAH